MRYTGFLRFRVLAACSRRLVSAGLWGVAACAAPSESSAPSCGPKPSGNSSWGGPPASPPQRQPPIRPPSHRDRSFLTTAAANYLHPHASPCGNARGADQRFSRCLCIRCSTLGCPLAWHGLARTWMRGAETVAVCLQAADARAM